MSTSDGPVSNGPVPDGPVPDGPVSDCTVPDDASTAWLDGVARVDAASWSLACRRARTLSQRELAAAAGVSSSTIARLESGVGRAAYDTVCGVLAATGYELVAVDGLGQLLRTDDMDDGPCDRAGRRLPIHLNPMRTRPYFGPRRDDLTEYDPSPWWGWHSIAWDDSDPVVPPWTFHRRGRAARGYARPMIDPEIPPPDESPATWENVVVGKAKEVVGRITGDDSLADEGKEQEDVAHEVREDFDIQRRDDEKHHDRDR